MRPGCARPRSRLARSSASLAGQAVAVHLRADRVLGRAVGRLHPSEVATAIKAAVPGAMADRSRSRMIPPSRRWRRRRSRPDRCASTRSACPALMGTGSSSIPGCWTSWSRPTSGPGRSRGCWRPLDLAAAFGSRLALRVQRAAGEADYATTNPRWPPCARRSQRGRTAPGAAPSTTRGWPRSTDVAAARRRVPGLHAPLDVVRQGPADGLRFVRGAPARHDPVRQAVHGRDG